jgi:hypothetical protein
VPNAIPLRIDPDVQALAVASDTVTLQLIAPRAYPPGQPLQLTLLPDGQPPVSLAARSIGSKRRTDEQFDVRVRLINLGRGAREALARSFAVG